MVQWEIRQGDCLEKLKELSDRSVQCCVTSPPYWGLRDYGVDGQVGLEGSPEEYVANMELIFREVRRVLRDDGTLWLNLGDSYSTGGMGGHDTSNRRNNPNSKFHGHKRRKGDKVPKYHPPCGLKHKDLVGAPWRVAFALQADGWYLRQDIIWHKPNPMPESIKDRCTKAHEYLFLMTKSERYYYDADAIKEDAVFGVPNSPKSIASPHRQGFTRRASQDVYTGKAYKHPQSAPRGSKSNFGDTEKRNKRTVWTVSTCPFSEAHFATFPTKLIEPCILAGSKPSTIVLDPFCGSGTTGMVALRHQREFIGIELNPEYVEMAKRRIEGDAPLFNRYGGDS